MYSKKVTVNKREKGETEKSTNQRKLRAGGKKSQNTHNMSQKDKKHESYR
jgi:hypothetical protein